MLYYISRSSGYATNYATSIMIIVIIPSLRLVFWLHNLLCFAFVDIYHGLVVPLRYGAHPHQHPCCCHRDHDHHLQDDGALEGVHHTWH